MTPELVAGFSFIRPFWLLGLLPCLALGGWLFRRAGSHSGWEAILPAAWLDWLVQRASRGSPWPFLLLMLGWSLAVLALAGPSIPGQAPLTDRNQASVVVVLDLSRNMLAGDVAPSRLARAQRKIRDLLLQAEGYRVGLVVYAGSAHRVIPVSDDYATLTDLLEALEPALMPAQGNDVSTALKLAREMIAGLPRRSSIVLLVTSGVEGADLQTLDAQAAELGRQLAILGVGTAAGSPVALPEGGFMRDAAGRILLPRLDAPALAALARRHGAAYHSVTPGDADLEHLLASLQTRPVHSAERQEVRRDLGHWLLLPLLLIAALGMRRGWLGVLLCVALLPSPQAEASWEDLWQRPDQQAMDLLAAQRAEEAAARFEDPTWRSWALFQAKRFEEAAETYRQVIERDPDNADSHHNYGTALAMAGRYEESLEAFEQALTRKPDHQPARHNRAQVEALLERMRQETERQAAEAGNGAQPEQDSGEGSATQAPGEEAEPNEAVAEGDTATAQQAELQTSPQTGQDSPPGAEGAATGATGAPLAGTDGGDISSAAEGDASSERAGPETPPGSAPEREQQQALQQWLEDIPDNPGELLRRKFLHQHMQQQRDQ